MVATWYLGQAPPLPGDLCWEALSALERLWPERLEMLLRSGARGFGVIAPVVDDALTLHACSGLPGIEAVLRRVRHGEASALSELKFAAALVQLGYTPALEPKCEGKVLDTLVEVEGQDVFVEVISPEMSDAVEELRKRAEDVAKVIVEVGRGCRIEVYLLAEPTVEAAAAVKEAVLGLASDPSDRIHALPAVALFRCETFRRDVGPAIDGPDGSPRLGVARIEVGPAGGTAAIVRVAISDERARRLLSAEAHHFSRDKANILVMDVSRVAGATNAWRPWVERCFQPGRSRRFGAVVLFDPALVGLAVTRRWRVVRNPHAKHGVPERLLAGLESLDQPI